MPGHSPVTPQNWTYSHTCTFSLSWPSFDSSMHWLLIYIYIYIVDSLHIYAFVCIKCILIILIVIFMQRIVYHVYLVNHLDMEDIMLGQISYIERKSWNNKFLQNLIHLKFRHYRAIPPWPTGQNSNFSTLHTCSDHISSNKLWLYYPIPSIKHCLPSCKTFFFVAFTNSEKKERDLRDIFW